MISNPTLEKGSFIYNRKRRLKRHAIARLKKRNMLFLIFYLSLITITSLFITYNIYVYNNSKDLGFAVEQYFTSGFSSENKLLRVQKMSLIYYDEETAIVEASGLSKKAPHKKVSVKGSFKKDNNKSWYLETIFTQ